MFKVSSAFKRFVFDGFDRCEYCQCVLYHVDDFHSVCLNCGSYFVRCSSLKPTSLFDTCSGDLHGKDDHEI